MTFGRRDPSLPAPVLEADGRGPHENPGALFRDRWRANTLVALGHPVVRRTWRDTLGRLAVPTMVRAALRLGVRSGGEQGRALRRIQDT